MSLATCLEKLSPVMPASPAVAQQLPQSCQAVEKLLRSGESARIRSTQGDIGKALADVGNLWAILGRTWRIWLTPVNFSPISANAGRPRAESRLPEQLLSCFCPHRTMLVGVGQISAEVAYNCKEHGPTSARIGRCWTKSGLQEQLITNCRATVRQRLGLAGMAEGNFSRHVASNFGTCGVRCFSLPYPASPELLSTESPWCHTLRVRMHRSLARLAGALSFELSTSNVAHGCSALSSFGESSLVAILAARRPEHQRCPVSLLGGRHIYIHIVI